MHRCVLKTQLAEADAGERTSYEVSLGTAHLLRFQKSHGMRRPGGMRSERTLIYLQVLRWTCSTGTSYVSIGVITRVFQPPT